MPSTGRSACSTENTPKNSTPMLSESFPCTSSMRESAITSPWGRTIGSSPPPERRESPKLSSSKVGQPQTNGSLASFQLLSVGWIIPSHGLTPLFTPTQRVCPSRRAAGQAPALMWLSLNPTPAFDEPWPGASTNRMDFVAMPLSATQLMRSGKYRGVWSTWYW